MPQAGYQSGGLLEREQFISPHGAHLHPTPVTQLSTKLNTCLIYSIPFVGAVKTAHLNKIAHYHPEFWVCGAQILHGLKYPSRETDPRSTCTFGNENEDDFICPYLSLSKPHDNFPVGCAVYPLKAGVRKGS